MPGTQLSNRERQLLEWWTAPNQATPSLRKISISGEPGLRGIKELDVRFAYPLTVLCGKNGNGKSTLLSLAALAFGAAAGHEPLNAFRKPGRGQDWTYYTFRDFFYRGPGDGDFAGVTISWFYDGPLQRYDGRQAVSPIVVRKRGDKWMHYERRPSRAVQFLGVARSVPSIEQRVLRSYFSHTRRVNVTSLEPTYREILAEVMMRPYEDAGVITSSRYSVRSARSGSNYSSFNMGAGEDVLIELLFLLQEAPDGALVAIEEIETGLHPEAVKKLAKALQDIIWTKKLQVVVTTHSTAFLDAVPRVARVLIQRTGTSHIAIAGPTARFAGGVLSGEANPEMNIYCEDAFAEQLIGMALTSETRRRVHVLPVGPDSALVQQGRFHQLAQMGRLAALVWDGDVSLPTMRQWLTRGRDQGLDLAAISWLTLPGAVAPERWVVETLDCDAGYAALSEELDDTLDGARQLITELRAVQDPHKIPYELHRIRNLRVDEAERALIQAVRRLPADPFADLRDAIQRMLARDIVQTPRLVENAPAEAAV